MKKRLHRVVAATLAALLVVAVAAGAAHSAIHVDDTDCVVCVLSHHAPAVVTIAVPASAPPQRVEAITTVANEPTLPAVRVTRGGRAPPRPLSVSKSRDA